LGTCKGSSGDGDDSGHASDSSGESGTDDAESGDGTETGGMMMPKLDVGPDDGTDDGGPNCDACGEIDFSYVWVANSGQGTVSKLNTRDMLEEGRYLTRPDGDGSPSRTSVNVDGSAVAVANRAHGLVKIWASSEDCEDDNGMAGIQTSNGPTDILAWDTEECVAWFNPFDGATVQRPVAWTPGDCPEDQKIWTVTGEGGQSEGQCGPGSAPTVHLVDGMTGDIDDSIDVSAADAPCTQGGGQVGAYGGAVDGDGNFWFHGRENTYLIRVDFETHDYEAFDDVVDNWGSYGITVDQEGRVWTTRYDRVSMFDYDTTSWTHIDMPFLPGESGLGEDKQGRIWTGGKGLGGNGMNYVGWVDKDTLTVGDSFVLNGEYPKGVSIDFDGKIWGVGGATAVRIEPDDYTQNVYNGLDGAYTYSDMAGGALKNVACPEG
jgi:hypothetical protein